jgi:hypothetical protein
MRTRRLAVLVATALLPACVSVAPTLRPDAAPASEAGYVAGLFTKRSGWGFGLGIVNGDTGQEFVIPFERDGGGSAEEAQAVAIAVPPGSYRIASWMSYASLTHERSAKREVPADHPLGRSFTLAPGQVVLIGAIAAASEVTYPKIRWRIDPRAVSEVNALATFRAAYPAFAAAPVTCLLCVREQRPRPASLELKPPKLDRPKRL